MSADPAPQAYAGIVTRAVAFVIDALLVDTAMIVLTGCVALMLSVLVPDGVEPGVAGIVAGLGAWGLVGATYFVAFWTLTGQTAGMRVMRLSVTDGSGNRPRLARSLVRLIGMWLAAIPLMAGYALILVDGRRQGLHDKLAGTFVRHLGAAVDGGVHASVPAHPRAPLSRGMPRDQTASDVSIDPEERTA